MRIFYDQVVAELKRVLLSRGCTEEKAKLVASVMADNSLVGVYTHGINRFKKVMHGIDAGFVDVRTEAERVAGLGGYEVYEGHRGLGIWNADICTTRVIELADQYGIGCVALRNTNHWLRGGTYVGRIADAGMVGIAFTNTKNNTVAWGTMSGCLGNNPIGISVPGPKGRPHIIVDSAMSQFAWGKLELAKLEGRKLPMDGGYDKDGNLTDDPAKIMESLRIMPAGLWKGSSLSLLLDLAAASLSGGNTVRQITAFGDEQAVSQIFIAVNYRALVNAGLVEDSVEDTIANLLAQPPAEEGGTVRYPGQMSRTILEENLKNGIPVDENIWAEIKSM